VDLLAGDSTDMALTIREEGEDTKADVFLSQSPGAMGVLAGTGLLRPVDPAMLGRLVDPTNAAPDGSWVGLSGRKRVLAYNTDILTDADLPDSVLDITAGRFDGRLGVAPTNASFQDFVTAMRATLGEDRTRQWLADVVGSGARTYANNVAILEAIARGEIDVGLVNHYYAYRKLAEDPASPVANHNFADGDVGSLLLVTSAGLIRQDDEDRSERADRLVDYLLSEPAQRYFADQTFEYPLVAGIPPEASVPPEQGLRSEQVDAAALEGGIEGTLALIREAGLST
jgi:iron(III) transport system substrate-binding protein